MIANVCLCLRFSRNVGPFYSLKPASNARHANENCSKFREREYLCLCASAIIHASMKTYVIAKWKKYHHAFCHQLRITYIKCCFINLIKTTEFDRPYLVLFISKLICSRYCKYLFSISNKWNPNLLGTIKTDIIRINSHSVP